MCVLIFPSTVFRGTRPAGIVSCKIVHSPATIVAMPSKNIFSKKPVDAGKPERGYGRFSPGSMVVATLSNPREKFWGMILALAPEGLSLSGAELASFDDLIAMVKDGEPFTPAIVFFPMHRVERVELDLPDGSLPSLSQRFVAKTGLEPAGVMSPEDSDRKTEDPLRKSLPRFTKGRA